MANKIETIAYSKSNCSKENWLVCTSGHVIKIVYEDDETAFRNYCKYFKVTIEEILEDDAIKLSKEETILINK